MTTRLASPRKVARRTGATVPRVAFDLLVEDPSLRAAAGSTGVQLGAALELSVDGLDGLLPGLGVGVEEYFVAARSLWAALSANESPPVTAVLVRVPLLDLRQKDSRSLRVDLSAQYEALEHVPAFEAALGLLDASPDWDALAAAGALSREGDRSSLALEVRSPVWPLELGSAPCPGEQARRVLLEASHAAWRDRRVRRLLRVRVDALQVWPDPAPFRSRLVSLPA